MITNEIAPAKTKTYSIHSAIFLAIAILSSSLFSLYPLYTLILLIVYRSLYLCFDVVSSCSCIFVFGFSCSSYRPALGFDFVSALTFATSLGFTMVVFVHVLTTCTCLCFASATTLRVVDTHLHFLALPLASVQRAMRLCRDSCCASMTDDVRPTLQM